MMPNRDHTGPNNKGPVTGRGFGNCNTENVQEDLRPRYGFGRGMNRRQQFNDQPRSNNGRNQNRRFR